MTLKRTTLLAGLLLLAALAGCRSAHVTSAILYLDQNQTDKAISVLHEGLEYDPEEAEAFFYLGEAHSKAAEEKIRDNDFLAAKLNYEQAYDYYQKAVELDPANLTERVTASLTYNYVRRTGDAAQEYSGGFFEAAEGHYRLAYAAYPDSTGPIKNIARMKIRLANDNNDDPELLGEALELLDEVLQSDPGAYALLADKANVLGRLGRSEEANAIYTQLMEEHPEDAGLLIDIANLAQEDLEYERAADLYAKVIDIYEHDDNPNNDEEILLLAKTAAAFYSDPSVLRYESAITYYGRALLLETVPDENTMLQKLQTHYKYGKSMIETAETEADPVRKAEIEAAAKQQFRDGVNVGNALVGSFFDSQMGFYYLALCHNELGDEAAFTSNMERWRALEGTAE